MGLLRVMIVACSPNRTLVVFAAKVRFEPKLTDAAHRTNVRFGVIDEIALDFPSPCRNTQFSRNPLLDSPIAVAHVVCCFGVGWKTHKGKIEIKKLAVLCPQAPKSAMAFANQKLNPSAPQRYKDSADPFGHPLFRPGTPIRPIDEP